MGMDCFYCTKDQRLLDLMIPMAEMTWSHVYLFRDQKHRGRCIVALKEHKDEIFQLSAEQRNGFFAEVSAVAEAIANLTKAGKINYAIYGDKVSHFHVHLVPKQVDGLQWGGPFTDTLPVVHLTDSEYQDLAKELLAELEPIAQREKLSLKAM